MGGGFRVKRCFSFSLATHAAPPPLLVCPSPYFSCTRTLIDPFRRRRALARAPRPQKPMEKKLLLGSHKEPFWTRPWRLLKTIFFVFTMLASLLLVCAPPLLVVGLDLLLPPALLSAALRSGPVYAAASPPPSLYDQLFASFDFRSSLVDLPAVSAARALLVLCKNIFARLINK